MIQPRAAKKIAEAAIRFFEAHREDYFECLGSASMDLDVEFMALGDAVLESNCVTCAAGILPKSGKHSPDCPNNPNRGK